MTARHAEKVTGLSRSAVVSLCASGKIPAHKVDNPSGGGVAYRWELDCTEEELRALTASVSPRQTPNNDRLWAVEDLTKVTGATESAIRTFISRASIPTQRHGKMALISNRHAQRVLRFYERKAAKAKSTTVNGAHGMPAPAVSKTDRIEAELARLASQQQAIVEQLRTIASSMEQSTEVQDRIVKAISALADAWK